MERKEIIDLTNYQNKLTLKNKTGRFLWNITYWLIFRPFSLKIFNRWRILVLKCFGAKIKGNVLVFSSVKIWAPWNLEIHEGCISAHTIIYNVDKVKIGRSAVISQFSHLCTASHDISSKLHPLITSPIIVEDQAWVAADTFIGPGVTIGQGAVVGARAVVCKNIEPWTVVGGNPAKFIKKRIIS